MKSYTKYWQNIATIMIVSGLLLLFPRTAQAAGNIVYEQYPEHAGGFPNAIAIEEDTTKNVSVAILSSSLFNAPAR